MAETKKVANVPTLEREYVIPLRKEYMKVPGYKRTAKSIKAIKEFIAKHMKVPGRDIDNVKIDSNNEVWFRGGATPPPRVHVKAIKTGDIVRVTFVQEPERVKFAKQRHGKKHFKVDKKVTAPSKEEKKEEKTEEQKKEESEKGKSVAAANEKISEAQAKAQRHVKKNFDAHKKEPLQRRSIASN